MTRPTPEFPHLLSRRPPRRRSQSVGKRARRRWAAVLILATLVSATVAAALSRAEAERSRWGTTRPVLVTTTEVKAGHPIGRATRIEQWPRTLVPQQALGHQSELPHGAVATIDLPAGMPLSPGQVSNNQAKKRPSIAFANGDHTLVLNPGDVVSVWATADPSLSGGSPSTHRITKDAIVVTANSDSTVVAVEPKDLADAVAASALATVTLVSEP